MNALQSRAVFVSWEREHAQLLRHLGRPGDGARRLQGGADEERRVGTAAPLRGLGRLLGQTWERGATTGTRFKITLSFIFIFLPAAKPRRSMDHRITVGGRGGRVLNCLLGKSCELCSNFKLILYLKNYLHCPCLRRSIWPLPSCLLLN